MVALDQKAAIDTYGHLARALAPEYVTPDLEVEDFEQEAYLVILEIVKAAGFVPEREMRGKLRNRLSGRAPGVGFLARQRESVSLDAELSPDSDGNARTLHDVLIADSPSVEDDTITRGDEADFQAAAKCAVARIDLLPASTRRVVSLLTEGRTLEEIAALTGMSERTVGRRRDEARRALASEEAIRTRLPAARKVSR